MPTILVAVSVLLPAIACAEDFVVGDGEGWSLGVDYQDWARDKRFKVGDRLVFNYKAPKHDVVVVSDGANFEACTVPSGSVPLMSGKDVIVLTSQGNKWYLCSKGNHCDAGMKLSVEVDSKTRSRRPRTRKSAASNSSASEYRIFVAVSALVVMAFTI